MWENRIGVHRSLAVSLQKVYMMGKQIIARQLTELWAHNKAIIKHYSSPFHLFFRKGATPSLCIKMMHTAFIALFYHSFTVQRTIQIMNRKEWIHESTI